MKTFLLGVLIILLLGIVGFVTSLNKTPKEQNNQPIQQEQKQNEISATDTLNIEDLVVGEGKEAVAGKTISVHYTGTLVDGTKFDSSLDRGEPFQFPLGAEAVIKGWEQGVEGMKVGGKRKLTIPPQLGYGTSPGHPLQNETLIFEIELLDVLEE